MIIKLDEKDIKILSGLADGTLDPITQRAARSFVNESHEGKHLTVTFAVDDWAKASMFMSEIFGMRKNSDVSNVTGVIFEKLNYDQNLDRKTEIGEGVIKLLENSGYDVSLDENI